MGEEKRDEECSWASAETSASAKPSATAAGKARGTTADTGTAEGSE